MARFCRGDFISSDFGGACPGRKGPQRQNPRAPIRSPPGTQPGVCQVAGAETRYFKTASLKAFAARRRTTVFALILIASPVAGLRPMRALRCAFTARPIPGMTNLPELLASFTASLNNSSKKAAVCFFEIGLSVVLTLSAICAMILDLLNGVAIDFQFPPKSELRVVPGLGAAGTIAVLPCERKH